MDEDTKFEDAPESANGIVSQPVRDESTPAKIAALEEAAVTSTTPPSNLSSTLQGFTDKALHFLAHSSNETLGACLVGLSATTYFIFGRVGLLVIGVAGGVVLHATWEGVRNDDRDEATKKAERDRRKETGVEVVKRMLDLRVSKKEENKDADEKVYASQKGLDYSSFEPKTAKALNYFTDCVIKDYVYWWYAPQLPGEESFPASCRRTFVAFMLSLSSHLRRKRPADAFLDFVTNASSLIIVFLNELAAATSACPNHTPAEAVSTYLELKPDSTLAYMLDQEAQEGKLKDTAEDVLQSYLDPKAYNCLPVHTFLKEVLAQLILGVTVTLCSRPEWINEWIVYGLEESETTREVMDIVDAGVEGRDQPVQEKKPVEHDIEHKRKISAAEEAMDEAMREAKRLTQMMIEEDEKKRREGVSSSEDVSDTVTTQGAPTPTSSQSDASRPDDDSHTASRDTQSPITPADDGRPATPNAAKQFTSFDQLVPSAQPTALASSGEASNLNALPTPPTSATLTLLNASISIFDDSLPNEKSSIKAKPTIDYLIQIEPANSSFPGWMIARKYADFESLHEVLRRISVITGVTGFAEDHVDLPQWRSNTKVKLRVELERYLTDAVRYQPLAESEGMKRFLEKDQGLSKLKESGGNAGVNAINKMGGDVFNVLSKAQKQSGKAVLGGSKAVFGGVTSLAGTVGAGVASVSSGVAAGVGAVGKKQGSGLTRTSTGSTVDGLTHRSQPSTATLDSYTSGSAAARQSQDSLRMASTPPRPALGRVLSSGSVASMGSGDLKAMPMSKSSLELSNPNGAASPTTSTGLASASRESIDDVVRLPPPPSEMPEDYGHAERSQSSRLSTSVEEPTLPPQMPPRPTQPKSETRPKEPLTDSETSVAVELMFAVITELYTLSSAWNFRRTLLSAAKTYLLRPGNPQLSAIRDLLQSSLLDSNLSDEGIAGHIYKLRENGLPTEKELEAWYRDYPEKNAEQKEELRVKARRLLVSRGMPTALQSVMGAAASGEALGRVFDCLQHEKVSRGLIFGLLVQAVKVVTD